MNHWPDPELELLLAEERDAPDPPDDAESRVYRKLMASVAAGAAVTVVASEAAKAATAASVGAAGGAATTAGGAAAGGGSALLLSLSSAPKALTLTALLSLGGGAMVWKAARDEAPPKPVVTAQVEQAPPEAEPPRSRKPKKARALRARREIKIEAPPSKRIEIPPEQGAPRVSPPEAGVAAAEPVKQPPPRRRARRRPKPAPVTALEAPMPKVDTALSAERRLLALAQRALKHEGPAAALRHLRAHEARFPNGRLIETRELLRIHALVKAQKRGRAEQAAAAFRRRFPKSLFLDALAQLGL